MRPLVLRGLAWIACTAGPMSACLWQDLNAVGNAPVPPPLQEADAQSPADAAQPTEAALTEAALTDTADAAGLACRGSSTPVRQWNFDTSVEAWSLSTDSGVRSTLAWTSATGYPSPGAIAVDAAPGDASRRGVWLRFSGPLGDLSGRTVAAWVWLDSGTSPHFKVFAQTGSQFAWADSGTITLPLRQWVCVSLDLRAPSYNGPGYDAANVVSVGFEMLAQDPVHLFVDSVEY